MNHNKKINPILFRVQVHFGVKTRKAMMEKWGPSINTLKTWVNRDYIPPKNLELLAEKEGLNIEWLRTGEGAKCRESERAS